MADVSNVVCTPPATPTITPDGPTTFCTDGSVTLTSSSATGNQWYLNGNPIGGATTQTIIATTSGNYTVVVTNSGCASSASAITIVTVNPIPATPTIGAGGPTTICTGGSVELTSSSATGNQWYLNGNPIGDATNQLYSATVAGGYTTIITSNSCTSAASAQTDVTVNPSPATPTITPGGPTTFCARGSVTLTSSSATGNQWYLNGNPIGGATSQSYLAAAPGDYTDRVTANGCSSATLAITTVAIMAPCITVPGAPLTPAASGSDGQATVTFSAPASNRGTPITGYTVTSAPAGGTDSDAGSTSLSHLITCLSNGTSYTFTVTATNEQGSGAPSDPSNRLTILASQTIGFGVAPTVSLGGTGTVSAIGGDSGNPLVFSSLTQGICTIAGTTVTGVSPSSCIIAAYQAGDAAYSAAQQVTQNFMVGFPTAASGNNPGGAGTITVSVSANPAGCGFSAAQFITLPNAATAGLSN